MSSSLSFGLLGPLQVLDGGRTVHVRAGKHRILLAGLLLRPNQVVSTDELIEWLWEGSPPARARPALQTYVARLRALLGDGAGDGAPPIGTRPGGYVIEVAPELIDHVRFRDLVNGAGAVGPGPASGGETTGPETELARLGSALALWRGRPMEDVPSEALRRDEGHRLTELWLRARERRLELALQLGGHGEVLGELRAFTTEQPLREHVRCLLMLALYRSGRQTEALAVYQDARRTLRNEFGIEPGPELSDVHRRILAGDPSLATPDVETVARETAVSLAGNSATGTTAGAIAAAPGSASVAGDLGSAARTVPAQLPHDLPGFTGRSAELAQLQDLLPIEPRLPNQRRRNGLAAGAEQAPGSDDRAHPAVTIALIEGAAGIGKTALAILWCHRIAGRFPDGQLYVDLRGFDPRQPPLTPAGALRQLLGALGVDPARIPVEEDGQAGLYRSLLAGKRVLVLLDNAASAAQVRPLLPGGSGALVVVTSRNRLGGLVARDAAHAVGLDLLGPDEALALLTRAIGPDRVGAEPEAARELARLCGNLPLALRVAAQRVAVRPYLTLRDLVAELGAERGRLDVLSTGADETTAVRAVFSWSYRALDPASARVFRLLGLHFSDIGTAAVAALAGVGAAEARRSLEVLAGGHLLEEVGAGRYRCHDLLRLYAGECAEQDETEDGRAEAVHRVLTWYLHTAVAASRALNPYTRHLLLPPPEPTCAPLEFSGYHEALDWCESERGNLVAAVGKAAERGDDALAWQLPIALWSFFNLRKHWNDWLTTHEIALSAAQRLGNLAAEASVHNSLGLMHWDLRDHGASLAHLGLAQEQGRALGNRWVEGLSLVLLGVNHQDLGRADTALAHHRAAAAIFRELGDGWGEGMALIGLGLAHRSLGQLADAVDGHEHAARTFREIGDPWGEGIAMLGLCATYAELGRDADAVEHCEYTIALARGIGDRHTEARALHILGDALSRTGRPEAAAEAWQRALTIFGDLADPQEVEVRARLSAPNGGTPDERAPAVAPIRMRL
jgi:DNA-binding SARP family transcriptional activator/tetratricopeptide (TPR) repeat protein